MASDKVVVLDHIQIERIKKRLAYEILETHFPVKKLVLAGINKNGLNFATLLAKELSNISEIEVDLVNIQINPASPLDPVSLSVPTKDLQKQAIILVDDVANTGRTLFYACKPLIEILPKSLRVAVLVDRKHKNFPVKVDFMGLSLATTLKENILVKLGKKAEVILE